MESSIFYNADELALKINFKLILRHIILYDSYILVYSYYLNRFGPDIGPIFIKNFRPRSSPQIILGRAGKTRSVGTGPIIRRFDLVPPLTGTDLFVVPVSK